ncbi:uncharacterized protein B0H18DRAFT_953826 [Fomitopsis serialis]|uniref:uncharacterized protein n=1 Tax=Fomitopsis serialis TaxID=139415 RepID=UPI002007F316|nr:uncharacterized protein B0H18DRAFT_953826 [Neoantrodia serialis]KAH9928936.1 hypothetical protein B0H18DRAFT_953826 [Neoantrodia serialis]
MEDPISLSAAIDSGSEESRVSPDERELEKQPATAVLVIETAETTTKVIVTATSTVRLEETGTSSSECSDGDDLDDGDFEQWKPRGPLKQNSAAIPPLNSRVRDAAVENTKAGSNAHAQEPKDKEDKVGVDVMRIWCRDLSPYRMIFIWAVTVDELRRHRMHCPEHRGRSITVPFAPHVQGFLAKAFKRVQQPGRIGAWNSLAPLPAAVCHASRLTNVDEQSVGELPVLGNGVARRVGVLNNEVHDVGHATTANERVDGEAAVELNTEVDSSKVSWKHTANIAGANSPVESVVDFHAMSRSLLGQAINALCIRELVPLLNAAPVNPIVLLDQGQKHGRREGQRSVSLENWDIHRHIPRIDDRRHESLKIHSGLWAKGPSEWSLSEGPR